MRMFGNARAGTTAGLAAFVATLAVTSPAMARTLCVGQRPACATTLRAAVAVARDGDTVRIARGTFDGGVVVRASIHLLFHRANVADNQLGIDAMNARAHRLQRSTATASTASVQAVRRLLPALSCGCRT